MTDKETIYPTVHLNGTDKQTLLEGVMDARSAIRVAKDTLHQAWPHARDYYVQGDNVYVKAREQWEEYENKLSSVEKDLYNIALNISNQGK